MSSSCSTIRRRQRCGSSAPTCPTRASASATSTSPSASPTPSSSRRPAPPVPVETRAVHPLLADMFAALDAAEIRWCLLRGEATLASPSGDIDMMVDPSQVRAMEDALAPLAVVPVERWGGGVHRSFLGYHAPTDRWIDLDVEPELAFGPHASFLVNW